MRASRRLVGEIMAEAGGTINAIDRIDNAALSR